MINTVLFDLDGTLLPIDLDEFMKNYFQALCEKCMDIMEPKALTKAIWTSTEYMIKNKEKEKTNMEAFMEDFKHRINISLEEILPVLDDFYLKDFNNLKTTAMLSEKMKEAVKILKDKNYKMVVATNPLFPRQAILHRIQWAGLDAEDFILITDYETMHYCKPNLEYYEEILSIIQKKPQECLMVGNDVQEDLIVSQLGVKTFLIQDHMINRQETAPCADIAGSYDDFYRFVCDLPNLKQE